MIEAPALELIQTIAKASFQDTHVPGATAMPVWQRSIVAWMLDNNR